jgi:hypothetical protein
MGLIIAPLPAKKQLWEAGDELVWKTENERDPGPQPVFRLATNGELVRFEQGHWELCGNNAVQPGTVVGDTRPFKDDCNLG